MRPTIGILGGIGPESSALFYARLIDLVQSRGVCANTDYPHIILESIPAPELLQEYADLTMYQKALQNLQKSGADFIVIICNTAYVYKDQLAKNVDIPIIDLHEEMEHFFKKKKIKSITIFGSTKTSDLLFKFGNVKIRQISKKDSRVIDRIILDYNKGKNKKELERKMISLVHKYPGTMAVVACTEISVMLKESGLKYIDTLDILLNATFQRWKTLQA